MTQLTKSINSLLADDKIKGRFNEILGEKAQGFISSVMNVVKNNDYLSKADPHSILQAAVVAATLDLPIDPNLGFAAIVPYGNKAQFQMMYKGFIQLAQRSGQYKNINVCEVYEGELIKEDRITGRIELDYSKRESDIIVGYVAYFSLINGFEKMIYWPIEKIDKHGKRFSKVYQKGSGLWSDKKGGGFEAMCSKTVLKHLLSKYGILSIEMQKAVKFDQATVNDVDSEDIEYIDNMEDNEPAAPANAKAIKASNELNFNEDGSETKK